MLDETKKMVETIDDITDICGKKLIESGFNYIDEDELILYAKMMRILAESKNIFLEQARLLDKIDEIDKKLDRLLSKQWFEKD